MVVKGIMEPERRLQPSSPHARGAVLCIPKFFHASILLTCPEGGGSDIRSKGNVQLTPCHSPALSNLRGHHLQRQQGTTGQTSTLASATSKCRPGDYSRLKPGFRSSRSEGSQDPSAGWRHGDGPAFPHLPASVLALFPRLRPSPPLLDKVWVVQDWSNGMES